MKEETISIMNRVSFNIFIELKNNVAAFFFSLEKSLLPWPHASNLHFRSHNVTKMNMSLFSMENPIYLVRNYWMYQHNSY